MNPRHFSPLDQFIHEFDTGLRSIFGQPKTTERSNPGSTIKDPELEDSERELSARLMRINHTGEVCAQALYQGQALTARNKEIKNHLQRSAMEENDHLDWCQGRIKELGSHTSLLNPLFYTGSLAIGALAGIAGDRWSLGFVIETEHQVEEHLNSHLDEISRKDDKSRAIITQMRDDEIEHADKALHAGGKALPEPVKKLMTLSSKVMTKTVYHI